MALRFDPMDAAFIADPYPTYARLRVEDPVHRSPLGLWVVTRYDDVATLLRDPRLLKAPSSDVAAARFGVAVPLTMLDMDPPDHTRLRGLVSQAFTPRAVEALRPRIQQIVDELLANIDARRDVARARPIDLIEQFAYPLPVIVICELLGVPLADHERFRSWSLDMARSLDAMMLPPGSDVLRRGLIARQALVGYFRELLAERRRQPRADMISALIAAEAQGERLSEDELLSTCVLLFVAGHETTVNVIGNGTLALLNNPEALHRLRTEPTLIASAVEEILRFDGPVHATSRFPSEDIVVRGTAIARALVGGDYCRDHGGVHHQYAAEARLDHRRTGGRCRRHLAGCAR